jgi:prolyl-tRNA synthetase
MKQSRIFAKTRKEIPTDADSINASYLVRAGFVEKQMAGVYSLLPLGYRVYAKIEKIIKEGMNAIDGQEILMNVLQPKELWEETGRWNSAIDIFFKLTDNRGKDMNLAPTHEEQVIDIVRRKINSYKNLPLSLYQIQTKFRNEPRVKSGLLRGREFVMKDMYSFHATEEDFWRYYERVKQAYLKVYEKIGLKVKYVEASGGIFSKYSHEFQVLNPVGEDTIYYCQSCEFAQNKEIAKVNENNKCPKCGGSIKMGKGIEVGNIFPLMTKFSEPMKATFKNKDGQEKPYIMGCYGLGLTRSLAAIVEEYYNSADNKMLWPKEVAPFAVHLISLNKNDETEKLYDKLIQKGMEVLFDDRDLSAGEKFAEADLIGCPIRLIVSSKSLESGGVELIDQIKNETRIISLNKVASLF